MLLEDTNIEEGHGVRPTLTYTPSSSIRLASSETSPPLLRFICFSPDGKYIAGAFDLKIMVWKQSLSEDAGSIAENWTVVSDYPLEGGGVEDALCCMSWAKSGVLLAGATTGDVLVVKVTEAGTSVHIFLAAEKPIKHLALNKDKSHLTIVAGDADTTIWKAGFPPVPPGTVSEEQWDQIQKVPTPEIQYPPDENLEVTFVGWKETDGDVVILAYLHHGVRSWNIRDQKLVTVLDLDTVIYAGALSPDGRYFSVPNRKSTFDIFDLKTKEKLNRLHDPDDATSNTHLSQRNRPGLFVHEGRYFIGAGLGKVNLWQVAGNIRVQRLSLSMSTIFISNTTPLPSQLSAESLYTVGETFSHSAVTLLAISDTDTASCLKGEIRVAACTQGPEQVITIWKARTLGNSPITKIIENRHESPEILGESNRSRSLSIWLAVFCAVLLSSLLSGCPPSRKPKPLARAVPMWTPDRSLSAAGSHTPLTSPPSRKPKPLARAVPMWTPDRQDRTPAARDTTSPSPNTVLLAAKSLSISANSRSSPVTAGAGLDIGRLLRERDKADHELKKARQREKYAMTQTKARAPLWTEARCEAVVALTAEYREDARLKRMAYDEAKRMEVYGHMSGDAGRLQGPEDDHRSEVESVGGNEASRNHHEENEDQDINEDSDDEGVNGEVDEDFDEEAADEEVDEEEADEEVDEEEADEEVDEERFEEETDEGADEERFEEETDEEVDEARSGEDVDEEGADDGDIGEDDGGEGAHGGSADEGKTFLGLLRSDYAEAQHQLKLARGRERYARKLFNANHHKWSSERVEEVAKNTNWYERDAERKRKRLEKAMKENKGRGSQNDETGLHRTPPSLYGSARTQRRVLSRT
ncbi:hypothetical protein D9611_001704 [Ephemerocybe angulata]|uniref:Uncharacterized protein n=1 Tax=Ephemerocybe angulata TaxID=980116 RepID=A0A8H5CHU7_9AGAR|nr:hypothetical protein D9611_001704 [Tulosesus angulatus]